MNDSNPSVILSPADFADTGQWRLIIYLSHDGMHALLRHVSDTSRPLVQLLNVRWNSEQPLLPQIEECIYDHPSLLDDYATDIILQSELLTWVPRSLTQRDEYSEKMVFDAIYPEPSSGEREKRAEEDILSDSVGAAVALYTFLPGFEAFISRILPGARLRSHLGVMVERLGKMDWQPASAEEVYRIFVDMRMDGMSDVILFRNQSLMSAVTGRFSSAEEVGSYVGDLLNLYAIAPAESQLQVWGKVADKEEIKSILSARCRIMPDNESGDMASGFPKAMALLAGLS